MKQHVVCSQLCVDIEVGYYPLLKVVRKVRQASYEVIVVADVPQVS